ncbi:hypothetical protein PGB90_002482 [Kerria lacca]
MIFENDPAKNWDDVFMNFKYEQNLPPIQTTYQPRLARILSVPWPGCRINSDTAMWLYIWPSHPESSIVNMTNQMKRKLRKVRLPMPPLPAHKERYEGYSKAKDFVSDGLVSVFIISALDHFNKYSIVALDCEMYFTTLSLEMTRATLEDLQQNEDMKMSGTMKTLKQVQENMLRLIGPSIIIVEHHYKNDL